MYKISCLNFGGPVALVRRPNVQKMTVTSASQSGTLHLWAFSRRFTTEFHGFDCFSYLLVTWEQPSQERSHVICTQLLCFHICCRGNPDLKRFECCTRCTSSSHCLLVQTKRIMHRRRDMHRGTCIGIHVVCRKARLMYLSPTCLIGYIWLNPYKWLQVVLMVSIAVSYYWDRLLVVLCPDSWKCIF